MSDRIGEAILKFGLECASFLLVLSVEDIPADEKKVVEEKLSQAKKQIWMEVEKKKYPGGEIYLDDLKQLFNQD